MTKNKKISFCVFYFAAISFVLYNISLNAQTAKTTDEEVNSLAKNNWSIIFEVGTFISSGVESFLLSSKYHISGKSAVRVGLGFNTSKTNETSDITVDTLESTNPRDYKTINITASADFIFYPVSRSSVTLFIGVGPVYHYEEWERNDEKTYGSGRREITHYQNKKWTAGLNAVLGAEYFIFKRISLIGEYVLSGVTGKTKTTGNQTSYYNNQQSILKTSTEGDVTEFHFNTVRLGASAYF